MESANKADVFITNHRNNSVALPIAPEEVTVNYETGDSATTIMDYGQINRVGDKQLKKISIDSTLPLNSDVVSYTTSSKSSRWVNAESYLTFLKNIVNDKQPVRLVISGTDITTLATLQFTYGMKNGNAQEYVVTLNFTEYVPVFAEKIRVTKKKKHAKKGKRRAKPRHKISRGTKVMVNGYAYLTKNAKHGVMIRKRKCHITMISKGSKHPYFVRDIYGTNMGWIGRGAFRL